MEGLVQVTALGPVPVKGLAEHVEAFELVGATAVRQRFQASAARGLTRFVGREPELAALTQALQRRRPAMDSWSRWSRGRMGKSRLVYECLHSHHAQGWQVLQSTSVSYRKATRTSPCSTCSGATPMSTSAPNLVPSGPK